MNASSVVARLLALASAVLSACAGDQQGGATITPATVTPETGTAPKDGVTAQTPEQTETAEEFEFPCVLLDGEAFMQGAELDVDESVRVACNLPNARAETPRFEFDEAELLPRGQRILTKLGHADARGTDAYNQRLGTRRAEAARDYLVSRGVPPNQLRLQSRVRPRRAGGAKAGGAWIAASKCDKRSAELAPGERESS